MSDTAPFDLSSATGRKATEAAWRAASGEESLNKQEKRIAAALAVYEDPVCANCVAQGLGPRGSLWENGSCPTCKDNPGQNPDQLVKLSEVVATIRHLDHATPLVSQRHSRVVDHVERWARKRPA